MEFKMNTPVTPSHISYLPCWRSAEKPSKPIQQHKNLLKDLSRNLKKDTAVFDLYDLITTNGTVKIDNSKPLPNIKGWTVLKQITVTNEATQELSIIIAQEGTICCGCCITSSNVPDSSYSVGGYGHWEEEPSKPNDDADNGVSLKLGMFLNDHEELTEDVVNNFFSLSARSEVMNRGANFAI